MGDSFTQAHHPSKGSTGSAFGVGGSLKVLHAPVEVAGQVAATVRALRLLGIEAVSCSFIRNNYDYPCDISLGLRKAQGRMVRYSKQLLFLAEALKYDVIHFHYGYTLLPLHFDLPLLRALGKRMVMEFWGSDVRQRSKATLRNQYAYSKNENEKKVVRNLRTLGKFIDIAIVADDELLEYVRGYFREVRIVPQRIFLPDYPVPLPSPGGKEPLIVHAPTNRAQKGTEHVIDAIERLRRTHKFQFTLLERVSHAEAISVYSQADIVVDQLRIGSYGILAIESMALGKPVITHIRDDLRSKYPVGLPIVSATPETVYDQIKRLLEDDELRHSLGLQGRKYVEENHDAVKVVPKLVELYTQ